MIALLKLLPYIGIIAALAGGGTVFSCQRTTIASLEGQRDVARAQVETVRAELADCRGDFEVEKRQTLAAIDAARRCNIEHTTQISLKNLDIAAKVADAARQRALLRRCSVAVPEILIERGGEMWPAP